VVLLVLLTIACAVIYAFSRRHRVDHQNVTDSAEVMVFAGAGAPSYRPPADEVSPVPQAQRAPRTHPRPTTRTGV